MRYMQDMTLEDVRKILEENRQYTRNDQDNKPFPWDRSYMTGYADGIEYACWLLSRIKQGSKL